MIRVLCVCMHSKREGQKAHVAVIRSAWASLSTFWQLAPDSFHTQRGKCLNIWAFYFYANCECNARGSPLHLLLQLRLNRIVYYHNNDDRICFGTEENDKCVWVDNIRIPLLPMVVGLAAVIFMFFVFYFYKYYEIYFGWSFNALS